MYEFKLNKDLFLKLLSFKSEREVIDRILKEMETILGDAMPDEEAVKSFLKNSDDDHELTMYQKTVIADIVLEQLEINTQVCCNLIRYKNLKEAGAVNSVEEFLELIYPDREEVEDEDHQV